MFAHYSMMMNIMISKVEVIGMCGITGEFNFLKQLKNQNVYLSMRDAIKHRGPNQEGIFMNDEIALAHTRLAIVDIERGTQPMIEVVENKRVVLVYNGELYNTEELRDECIQHGVTFNTHSDTEVVLKSYLVFKENCVKKMNGIFAFVIYDERENKVFMARDRFGVKPLFYVINEQHFLFASEMKSLFKHPDVKPIINTNSLYELICVGPGRTQGQGIFKGIMELKPASYAVINKNEMKVNKYWELEDKLWEHDFDTTVKLVRDTTLDAIKRQLVSDVKVCTLLSGGLDSSILSAVASKEMKKQGKQLDTISVEYVDNEQYFKPSYFQPNRDEHYVNVMSKAIDSNHHFIVLSNESVVDALFDAVKARDLPGMVDIDSSLYLFCKEIKKVASVALSGECADELFGGYPWYKDKRVYNSPYFPWSGNIENRMSFLKEEFKKWDGHEYVLNRVKQTRDEAHKKEGNTHQENRMKEMMKLNIDWFMQTLLDRKDRMSMSCGLEVRVPFCDYRIVEMCYSIPWEMKNYKDREKGLLREAMKGILPDEILWRKKSPYPKTHHPAYKNKVKSMLKEIIDNEQEPIHQFIKKERLIKLLNENDEIPWYGQLMTTPQTMAYFVQMNYWLKEYHVQFEE